VHSSFCTKCTIHFVACSVVTVLDFSFSVGFGSVLEEKPTVTVSISVFQPLCVGQSMREEMRGSCCDMLCTRSARLSVETEAYKIG